MSLYFCDLSQWKGELQHKDLNTAPLALAFHHLEDVSTANDLQGFCVCSFVFSLFFLSGSAILLFVVPGGALYLPVFGLLSATFL